VVVAAGNTASADAFGYAGLPGVLTVGAADTSGERAMFSNGGVALDLIAPGVDLLSLRARGTDFLLTSGSSGYVAGAAFVDAGRYYRATGTSFAAALVSGVASRLLSLRPSLTNVDLTRVLQQSARDIGAPGVDQSSGYGYLDFRAALAQDAAHWIAARITRVSPNLTDGAVLLDVQGQADADRFSAASLDVRAAGTDDWRPVGEPLSAPVGEGTLGRIDLTALLAGSAGATRWQLRLVVRHADGSARESWMDVELPVAAQTSSADAEDAR
jgi:subtilisin family serine protease